MQTTWVVVDFGLNRETVVACQIEDCGVAGRITCMECGGDGDWKKFHPEPETIIGPYPCVDCKGTGRVYVSF